MSETNSNRKTRIITKLRLGGNKRQVLNLRKVNSKLETSNLLLKGRISKILNELAILERHKTKTTEEDYQILVEENYYLTEDILKYRKARQNLFKMHDEYVDFKIDAKLDLLLNKNANFIKELAFQMINKSRQLKIDDDYVLTQIPDTARTASIYHIIKSAPNLELIPNAPAGSVDKLIVRSDRVVKDDYIETTVSLEFLDLNISYEKSVEIQKWSFESDFFLTSLSMFLQQNYESSNVDLGSVTSALKTINLKFSENSEEHFHFLQQIENEDSFVHIRTYMPNIDYDLQAVENKTYYYYQTSLITRGSSIGKSNYTQIFRLKEYFDEDLNLFREDLDVNISPTLNESSIIPFAKADMNPKMNLEAFLYWFSTLPSFKISTDKSS